MYKIETHLHTSEVSRCAKLSAEEMIKFYAQAGYDVVLVTDHYTKRFFNGLGDISWKEKAEKYLLGYKAAFQAGKKFGVTVLLSMELTFDNAPNDYLVYGITEKFIENNPELYESSIEKFYPIAKENGFLVIQAHPFRDKVCYPTIEFVDGLEIYNTNPRHEDYNERTKVLAEENNLLFTAGSDAHRSEDATLTGLISTKPVFNMDDFIALIRSKEVEVVR